jgi:hypothetical protein
MRHPDWQHSTDEELERLLIERWLSRGLMVGILAVIAILSTYVASRGLTSAVDLLTFAALLALGVAAAGAAFAMRQHDLEICRELRRRRMLSRRG